MINAPYEKEFVFNNGQRVKNLLELEQEIGKLSYDEFLGFVNDYKNDFADWMEYVLNDKKLADRLRMTKSQSASSMMIRDRINEIVSEEKSLAQGSAPSALSQGGNEKAHKKWLRIFRKKHTEYAAEQKHEHKTGHQHQAEHHPEEHTGKEHEHPEHKKEVKYDRLWTIIYYIIIALIIFLVVYKFILGR